MKRVILLTFSMLFCQSLVAHPAWGIVVSPDGNLYFADIFHNNGTIWKTDKNGSGLTALLKNHHSHDIHLDNERRIWGTHDDFIEADGENEVHLWRLSPQGKKKKIIPETRNLEELSGAVFTIDDQQNIYYTFESRLYKRTLSGLTQALTGHQFGRVTTIKIGPGGNIFLADNQPERGKVYQITPDGEISGFAGFLKDDPPKDPPFPEPRFDLLYGMDFDHKGNLYITNSGGRKLVKVTNSEKGGQVVSTIYRSEPPWYPVGIALDGDDKFLMEVAYESGIGNYGPRIIKIDRNNNKTVILDVDEYLRNLPEDSSQTGSVSETRPAPIQNLLIKITGGLLLLLVIILLFYRRVRRI